MLLDYKLGFDIGAQPSEFRTLYPADVTENYVEALRHQREYIENNPPIITLSWQQEYVQRILGSETQTLAGLFLEGELVGTAGIQGLRPGEVATLGIFVLGTRWRGRGFGKTLVWSASKLAHTAVGVNRIEAGMKKSNVASLRSFISCGYVVVSDLPDSYRVALDISDLKPPEIVKHVRVMPAAEGTAHA